MTNLPWIASVVLCVCVLGSDAAARRAHLSVDDVTSEVQDKRTDVAVQLKALAGHAKRRGAEDDQAIAAVQALIGEFAGSGPKDRGAIVKGVAACLKVKRKELEEDVPDDRLQRAAAVALGSMAPDSTKVLVKSIGAKKLRDNMQLQIELVRALGKTKSLDGVKTLTGLLKHKDAELQAAGAQALGGYREAELGLRKDVFHELLKTMMAQKAQVDANTTDPEASRRYSIIVGPIIGSLQLLSGENMTNPDDWQRWWNKNKKGDWDEAEEG